MKRASVALVLLVAATAWCQGVDADKKALEGKWTPVTAELAGAKLEDSC